MSNRTQTCRACGEVIGIGKGLHALLRKYETLQADVSKLNATVDIHRRERMDEH